MRSVSSTLLILACAFTGFASEIRQFSVPTLERLGNELSHRDEISARAEDAVLAEHPEFKSVTPQWWISDPHKDGDIVYLIDARGSEPTLAYKVIFGREKAPTITDMRGQPLPPQIALRYKALQTGIKAVSGKLFTPLTNFEVLNDPDKSGFVVYALAVSDDRNEILTGGHYRITVSADGSIAERVDLLSQLIRSKPDSGHEAVGIGASQLSSDVPVETWLYSSYLYHMPMAVATRNGSTWMIANGKIHKFTKAEVDAMQKEKRK